MSVSHVNNKNIPPLPPNFLNRFLSPFWCFIAPFSIFFLFFSFFFFLRFPPPPPHLHSKLTVADSLVLHLTKSISQAFFYFFISFNLGGWGVGVGGGVYNYVFIRTRVHVFASVSAYLFIWGVVCCGCCCFGGSLFVGGGGVVGAGYILLKRWTVSLFYV